MVDVTDDLKSAARVLHRAAQSADPDVLKRVRALGELRDLDDDTLAERVRRRHCLSALARELGCNGWSHLTAMLGGPDASNGAGRSAAVGDDFGTFLYPKRGGDAFWNIWSASYEEAQKIREQHGGYLLAYKRQFFIVESHFIDAIGLSPDDVDWELIGRDWPHPADPEARGRLAAKLIRHRLAH